MRNAFFCMALSGLMAATCVQAKPIRIQQQGDAPQKPPIVKNAESNKKININKATSEELLHAVKGIGQKRAQAIVAYRDTHESFKSLDELASVKGFGKHYVQTHHEELEKVFTTK